MERSVAIKKLTKLLGKSLGYRVDLKAPGKDGREDARIELQVQRPIRDDLAKAMNARRLEILQADAEYQRLKAAHLEVEKVCQKLGSATGHYRFTVGTSSGMFFMVKAQGDSWEEVIAKIEKDKQPV